MSATGGVRRLMCIALLSRSRYVQSVDYTASLKTSELLLYDLNVYVLFIRSRSTFKQRKGHRASRKIVGENQFPRAFWIGSYKTFQKLCHPVI